MSEAWVFGNEPFPAYRANLVYGHNKRDREFMPVKDVAPVIKYNVTDGKVTLYSGTNKATAEAAKADYDAAQKVNNPESSWPATAHLSTSLPTLPEGQFRVIKTKEKGTILIVPGSDNSNRCLLFVGCVGGFRGGESILKDGTTGTVLKVCSAGNNCESSTEAIVLLELGQMIVFHSYGRRTDEVYTYLWNGEKIEEKHFSRSEWDNRGLISATQVEDAEVL